MRVQQRFRVGISSFREQLTILILQKGTSIGKLKSMGGQLKGHHIEGSAQYQGNSGQWPLCNIRPANLSAVTMHMCSSLHQYYLYTYHKQKES